MTWVWWIPTLVFAAALVAFGLWTVFAAGRIYDRRRARGARFFGACRRNRHDWRLINAQLHTEGRMVAAQCAACRAGVRWGTQFLHSGFKKWLDLKTSTPLPGALQEVAERLWASALVQQRIHAPPRRT